MAWTFLSSRVAWSRATGAVGGMVAVGVMTSGVRGAVMVSPGGLRVPFRIGATAVPSDGSDQQTRT